MTRNIPKLGSRIAHTLSRMAVVTVLSGALLVPAATAQGKYDDVHALFDQQQYDAALKLLQRKQNNEDADSELYLLLARAYLENGAGIAAEASVERARRLGADYAGTAVLFAKSLLVQGKYAEALGAIRGVTISADDQIVAYIIAGDANFALRNMAEARRNYELARQQDEDNFQAYLGLARLAMREGDLNSASELIEAAAVHGPKSTMVHYTWGLVARYLGKMDEAEQHFVEARRLFPANIMANIELASISIDRGALSEAELYLDGVYAVAPNYPMALYLSSVILASRSQFEQSYSLLNRARGITENYLPAMYVRGLVAYQLGHYTVAETHLRRVIRARPNSLSARMALAGTYLRQERPQAAYEVLLPVIEAGNPDPTVIAMAAAASMAGGQPQRGRELYELLAEEEGKSPDDVLKGLASKLALARFVAGSSNSAAEAILTQPPTEGVDVRELGVLGSIQLRAGDDEGARVTIDKILAALPDRALGYNMRGTLEYQKGDYPRALASFKEAIARNPDYHTATRNKALAEVQLAQYAEAEQDLKKLLKAQPSDARSKALLGRVLLRQEKGQEAISYFEEAIRVIPGAADLEADYAQALAIAGQTARAIEQARETAVLSADRPDLLRRMGILLLDMKQARLAVRPLSRYVAFNPDNGEAHMLHGRALLAMGLTTGAKTSFQRAMNAETNKVGEGLVAWYLFAVDAFSGKYREALATLPQLDPALQPDDIRPSVIGDTLVAAGRYDDAIAAYETAMERQPASDLATGLAAVHERQNRRQSAIQVLENYLKAYPDDRSARMALGNMFEGAGLPAAATRQYELVLRAGVADAHVVASLARAYLRLGNKKSVPLAERAYLIMPEDPFILDIYGWVMLQANRDAELAEKAISKASRRAPSVALYRYHLGMTYLAQGRRELALETLQQAIRLDPGFEEAEEARRQIELLE